jgi:hypothetical protein
LIPHHLKIPENKDEIIRIIMAYLLKNVELKKLIQETIEKSSLDFENLMNVSTLVQSKIPLQYLYDIPRGFLIAGAVFIGCLLSPLTAILMAGGMYFDPTVPTGESIFMNILLPIYGIVLWPSAIILSPFIVLSFLYLDIKYYEAVEKTKIQGILSILKTGGSKVFIEALVQPFKDLIKESEEKYKEKKNYAEKIPTIEVATKVLSDMESSYLNVHKNLFELKFQNVSLKQNDKLGNGSFGTVWKETINEKIYAVKILNRDYSDETYSEMLGNRITHKHFVKTHYFTKLKVKYYSEKGKEEIGEMPCLLMEYISGDNLSNQIIYFSDFKPEVKIKLFLQMAEAVEHLHCLQIFLRDIKPDNFILEDNSGVKQIKIIDFGSSKRVDHSNGTIFIGTKGWMAPEVYEQYKKESKKPEKQQNGEIYDISCDIFSLGITFALLWEGKKKMVNGSKDPQVNSLSKHSEDYTFGPIKKMIEGCCWKDPKARWKIEEVVKILSELNSEILKKK